MQNDKKKIFPSALLLTIALLALIVSISIPTARVLNKRYKVNKEISDMEEEIAALNGKSDKLGKLVAYLDTESFVEEKARLNLNLKKDGEEVVVINRLNRIVASGSDSTYYSIKTAKADQALPQMNYSNWISYFFDKRR